MLHAIKRRLRRTKRRVENWSTVVGLTLAGKVLEQGDRLRGAENPIFLIYGFGATQRTLAILEHRLRQDGYPFFSMNLGGLLGTFNTANIEQLAEVIHQKIDEMYRKYRFKGKLTIIGHSKGGLIGHYYIKKRDEKARVKKLITLGTPHNGTPWAMMAAYTAFRFVFRSLRQMSPDSEFLQELKSIPFPQHVRVYSIFSKDDIVCPFPMPVLPEAKNVTNIEVPGISHSELLIKKNIYYAVHHAIHDQMPKSWSEATQKSVAEHNARKSSSDEQTPVPAKKSGRKFHKK